MAQEGRHWSGYVYYYAASLIGLGFMLAGGFGVFQGLIQTVIPRSTPQFAGRAQEPLYRYVEPVKGSETPATPTPEEKLAAEDEAEEAIQREGLYRALQGAGSVVIGAPVFIWHIRRARAREGNVQAAQGPVSTA